MDFDKLVQRRVSATSFTSKRPSWKAAMLAIDAALEGPFAGNKNNLKFIIVENHQTIQKLAEHADQDWIKDTKLVIAVISDDSIPEDMYGERGRVYSRQQAGSAVQTILFKLIDQGLAGCWVGAYDDKKVRDDLKIPSEFQIEALIPVGYSSGKNKKKRKVSLGAALHWETYGMRRRPTGTEEHELKDYD